MRRGLAVAGLIVVPGWLAIVSGCAQDAPQPVLHAMPEVIAGAAAPAPNTDAPQPDPLIPARIRRLSNAEYDGSVAALLGTELSVGRGFAPDARQAGFSANAAQRVDAVLAKQLFAAAEQLASEARSRFGQLAPCATPGDPEPCARSFIAGFGARAYRRPLLEQEAAGLLEVFRAGALDASYEDGIELVIRALLQSAGFLYATELGDGPSESGAAVALTPHELASSLAYLVTGAPPDRALLDAAAISALDSPEGRRAQLERLRRESPASRAHLVRTLREWLELDRIEFTAKDGATYPKYDLMKEPFIAESHAFIAAVLDEHSADTSDLGALLGADWTVGDQTLAKFYEAQEAPGGRLELPARRGILNRGAFLSVQSHAHQSAPVLRGALIARRLACIEVPAPETLGLDVLPPAPDPSLTTRQRFAAHAANPSCAQCHGIIDGFGNAFEQYDGMGALRHTENAVSVDSTTVIEVGADFDGAYPDSDALAEALAGSASVNECFARHLFRAATARSAESDAAGSAAASEDAFITEWHGLPASKRGNVMDTLGAFVSSRLFTHRRAP